MNSISPSSNLLQTSSLSLEKFQQAAKLAGDSGRVVVSKSASGTPELSVAKYTLGERALRYLGNLMFSDPLKLTGHLSHERATVINHFVTALEQNYGERAAGFLTSHNQHLAFAKVDLDQKTIENCMQIAQGFINAVATRSESPTTEKSAIDSKPASQLESSVSASDEESAFDEDIIPEDVTMKSEKKSHYMARLAAKQESEGLEATNKFADFLKETKFDPLKSQADNDHNRLNIEDAKEYFDSDTQGLSDTVRNEIRSKLDESYEAHKNSAKAGKFR